MQFVTVASLKIDWYQPNWQRLVLYNFDIFVRILFGAEWPTLPECVALPIFCYFSHYIDDGPLHALWFHFCIRLTTRTCFSKCTGFCWVFHRYLRLHNLFDWRFHCAYIHDTLTVWCVWAPVGFASFQFALSCLRWQIDSKERQQQQRQQKSRQCRWNNQPNIAQL